MLREPDTEEQNSRAELEIKEGCRGRVNSTQQLAQTKGESLSAPIRHSPVLPITLR